MSNSPGAINYTWWPKQWITQALIVEMSELFSAHYGEWATGNPGGKIGKVKFGPGQIKKLLTPDFSAVAMARAGVDLVGYAIILQIKDEKWGVVSWVTQLVVHRDFRNLGIAKQLLFSCWSFSDHYAWGLVSANPYAVRALEKATRRRCDPRRIGRNKQKMHRIGCEHIPYIEPNHPPEVTDTVSRIDTKFFVDHSGIEEMIRSASLPGVPWQIGELEEGMEWFAFTFRDQEQLALSPEEIHRMLETGDEVMRQAYSRMTLDETHTWAKHTADEVKNIVAALGLAPGARVLDVGCGKGGRHSLDLARAGMQVTGVEFVSQFVDAANREASKEELSAVFLCADARTLDLPSKNFDGAICLYDVIGSYTDDSKNQAILDRMALHISPGKKMLISVMSLEFTLKRAKNFFSLISEPDKLIQLRASSIMETTGNVFDPEFYLVDSETKLVYRKERFSAGGSLPCELIVRDRRYFRDEIMSMCERAGLRVLWVRAVRAGRWDEDHVDGKEILVCCMKPEPLDE